MNRQSAGNDILEFYNKNKSIIKTAQKFNMSYEKTRIYLRKLGVKSTKRKPVKVTGLKLDYFKNIDDSVKAYFLGFIKADGYVDEKRNRLAIRIQERDVVILKRFCDAVGITQKKISYINKRKKTSVHYSENRSQMVEVNITNKEFVSYLLDVKKESIIKKIPEKFAYDFIRGYFDGDGSINYHDIKKLKFSCNIMGSPDDDSVLQYILKYITGFKLYTDKRSSLPFLQTASKQTIIDFANKCFTNCYIYLPRKKQKFDFIKFILKVGTSTTTRGTTKKLVEDIV